MPLLSPAAVRHRAPRAASRRAGFSLLEVLVSVAVLAILSTLALTRWGPTRTTVATRTLEIQLQHVARAQEQYRLTHGQWAPTLEDLQLNLPAELPLLVQQPLTDGYRLVLGHAGTPAVCVLAMTETTPAPAIQCETGESEQLAVESLMTETDIIYTLQEETSVAQMLHDVVASPLGTLWAQALRRPTTTAAPRQVVWQTSTGDRIVTTPAAGTQPTLVLPRTGTALTRTTTPPPVRAVVLEPTGAVRQAGTLAVGGVWARPASGAPRGAGTTGTPAPTTEPPRQTDGIAIGDEGRLTTWDTTLTQLPSTIPEGYTFPANPTTGLDLGNGVILPMATQCLPSRRAIRALLSEEQYGGVLDLKTSQYLTPAILTGYRPQDMLESREGWMFRLAIRAGYVAPTTQGLDAYLGWHGDGYWGRPEPFRSFIRLFYQALAEGRLTAESVIRSEQTPMPTTNACATSTTP